ncbi:MULTISPECIES: ABC transporter ATP-binding protein [Bacillus]|uniref:ABC transporter ATP-binding protein n=1 Tax=Bacillus TaxID=1386 RepID=UPI00019FFB3C|nr:MULTISPECIES: ABC transporter ATP-binding protein [Bacillus cereus group]AJG59091.1 aliphatic sulfonates import ATP-binding protein SsuB [Bacillus cereus D17]EEK56018.1 Aliphatic sulfonates import ATP-binding protein ssuB [Bacillus cereus BGSC 6E1]MCC2343152.1 ABC transporter ATP-binding protein [Bacillus anthracis]MCE7033826.1 ABC transporter ATP-binding protein [Bacillus cereus]MCU5055815.1 ABC transporter ATP-binding protein [Bacillus cereus]
MTVSIHEVSKYFWKQTGTVQVLENINFQLEKGDFVTVIGPSGCGKSTLLKIVAGLDNDFEGEIIIDGERITKPSKKQGFIFQEHRLFPWLTVEENIAADLSLKDKYVKDKVKEWVEIVRLDGFEKSYPKEISGGMSQRVAIARALLRDPSVLLLDEPFGALDAFTRSHLQEVLLNIWEQKKTTMIFVTHDIDEAIYLSNRIVIMSAKPGEIHKVIENNLSYPRNKTSQSFQQLRTKVLQQFEHGGLIQTSI